MLFHRFIRLSLTRMFFTDPTICPFSILRMASLGMVENSPVL